MYYNHFGLNQAPFKITPNTEFFFTGGNRGPILEALIYAISHGEGIIKVTGEVGSGKTMLCHMLPTRLPAHIEIVYIANPSVSPEEILLAIAFELQLPVGRDATRFEVMQAMQAYLVKRHGEGKRVVVFVEESQSMPLATLEEIRLLSNLETKNDKLLQIVLFGQPELDDNLRQPNIRQLRERITHSFRLEPLAQGEIREYLMFRMRAAGYHGPDLFPGSVVKHITRASLGLTRRVNLIADKALLSAFSENTHTLRPKHVEAAVRDSEFSQNLLHRAGVAQLGKSAALVATGAIIGFAVYAALHWSSDMPAQSARAPEATAAIVTEPAPGSQVAPQAPPTAAAGQRDAKPVATASAIVNAADLLGARLAATEQWLAHEKQETLSIQLMGVNDPEKLEELLNTIAKSIEINNIFVYRTLAMGQPSMTVLYGSFDNPRAARAALDKLPPSLRGNRPMLRTVQGIRAEIQQHGAS